MDLLCRLVVSAAAVSTDAMTQELQLLREENSILTDAAGDSEQLHLRIEQLQGQLLQLQQTSAAAPVGGAELKSCMANLHAQREENRLWRQRVAAYEQEIETYATVESELLHARRDAEAANERCAAEQGENFNLKQELESSGRGADGLLRNKDKEKLDRAEEVCRGVYATLQLVNHKLAASKSVNAAEFDQFQTVYLQLVYRRLQEETGGQLSRGVAWQLYSMLDVPLNEDQFDQLLAELVDGGSYVDFHQVSPPYHLS